MVPFCLVRSAQDLENFQNVSPPRIVCIEIWDIWDIELLLFLKHLFDRTGSYFILLEY